MITIAFAAKTLSAEVLKVEETVKKEEAGDLYRLLPESDETLKND